MTSGKSLFLSLLSQYFFLFISFSQTHTLTLTLTPSPSLYLLLAQGSMFLLHLEFQFISLSLSLSHTLSLSYRFLFQLEFRLSVFFSLFSHALFFLFLSSLYLALSFFSFTHADTLWPSALCGHLVPCFYSILNSSRVFPLLNVMHRNSK